MKWFQIIFLTLFVLETASGQVKKPLTHDVYDGWKSIQNVEVGKEGKFLIYQERPQEGDATLKITEVGSQKTTTFSRIGRSQLTENEDFVIFTIQHPTDSIRILKLKKTKKDDLPKDSLAIFNLENGNLVKIPFLKSFQIPEKSGRWLAYQIQPAPEKKSKKEETSSKEKKGEEEGKEEKKNQNKKKKPKKPNDKNGYSLVVRHLTSAKEDTFKFVKSYVFTEKGEKIAFTSSGEDSLFAAGVYVWDLDKKTLTAALTTEGDCKNLAWDEAGKQLAFVADTDTSKTHKNAQIKYYQLFYWSEGEKNAQIVADTNSVGLPTKWLVSEHEKPRFSKDGSKLYFGTMPVPPLPDTTLLDEERVKVDVWSWTDGFLQPQQLVNAEKDKKKAFLAVVFTDKKKIVQLANEAVPMVLTGDEGNADVGIGLADEAYRAFTSWEGFPSRNDVFILNFKTGQRRLVRASTRGRVSFSPMAKFLIWYEVTDSSWYAYGVESGKLNNLTKGVKGIFYQEENDIPDFPDNYGVAAWTKNDERVLIYDRYDLWAFDPTAATPPVRLTNGRVEKWVFRYVNLDEEKRFIEPKEVIFLSLVDEKDKSEGYASLKMEANATPKVLIKEAFSFGRLQKAKNADQFVFTKGNFQVFPNLWLSDGTFQSPTIASDANPQQATYLWGTVEMTSWYNLDGVELKGLIYKPENFDPSKKYPLMVYFYEKYSDRLHSHYAPSPMRSIVNFTYLVSNGYVVFVPDVIYKDGFPGESAYNCIVPGVMAMMDKGYVDKDRIGVQGHSWGGYQTAYLVTRTNLFRAAEAGAPVSNMTSAYGGIRWETGLSRMFQYEHTQSRIGGTLWEKPMRYLENSPVFSADKIQTPLLILHNDEDGAVPWYQGIELFVALRRLGRPCWLLNYNGEPHWVVKRPNQKDFTKRVYQFFDHYLKDAPAPKWLNDGVPATHKGLEFGLELEEKEDKK